MPPTVDESWDRIVGWLGRHAPRIAAAINPPATESALAQAEATLRLPLPADLMAWWRRANGMRWTNPLPGALVPPGFVPYSIEDALKSRRMWLDVMRAYDEQSELPPGPAGSPCDVWLPVWMPIAADGCGAELFVDLRGGPTRGCVMEYDKVGAAGYEDATTSTDVSMWPSVASMLAEVADALEHEALVRGVRIWADDNGGISWDTDASRWVSWDRGAVDFAMLRERYAAFVAEARSGNFGPARSGSRPVSWSAEWIAAHVARNTELLIDATRRILAVDPVGREQRRAAAWAAQDLARFKELATPGPDTHYDNSDSMDPATLDRYAASGLVALAERISQLGARLCDVAEPLNRARPTAHVRVIDAGSTVVDENQSWVGVLNALSERQLPRRTRQLRALR